MHRIILILLLIVLALGGCAATVWVLQPTVDNAAHAWVQAETRTDPVDDLIRFRQAEQDGRAGTILLPVFIILSLALLLLLLTTPSAPHSQRTAPVAQSRSSIAPTSRAPVSLVRAISGGTAIDGTITAGTAATNTAYTHSRVPPPHPNEWLENKKSYYAKHATPHSPPLHFPS